MKDYYIDYYYEIDEIDFDRDYGFLIFRTIRLQAVEGPVQDIRRHSILRLHGAERCGTVGCAHRR